MLAGAFERMEENTKLGRVASADPAAIPIGVPAQPSSLTVTSTVANTRDPQRMQRSWAAIEVKAQLSGDGSIWR
jgi:hypothetical protein